VPGSGKVVVAKVLVGPEPTWPAQPDPDTGRNLFASWVTARDNPYFARNAVNRLWANLFGIGLGEPLDDLSGENPASHPELLDELARAFVDSEFDLKYLSRALTMSRAYQLAAITPGDPPPRLFARSLVRGLTGEQLYDSLRVPLAYRGNGTTSTLLTPTANGSGSPSGSGPVGSSPRSARPSRPCHS
jgi:Protein of unknown function (DUF1553)